MAKAEFNHKAANLWTSRVIPLVLIGIVGYGTWVMIVLLCGRVPLTWTCYTLADERSVNYLLKPSTEVHPPRHGAAIAILVLYVLFLLLIGLTYCRLLYVVTFNPGYVPLGPKWHTQQEEKVKATNRHSRSHKKSGTPDSTEETTGGADSVSVEDENLAANTHSSGAFYAPGSAEAAPGLQEYYKRDAFVCQGDGRPIWCSTCLNWKPDRAHHCREIERCVRKMDHFCPWYVIT